MPSMILQPIVENSVNHGIREMNGEGKIRLKVYHVDGDTLGISIRDNGIGMNPDTIEKALGAIITKSSQAAVPMVLRWGTLSQD